MNGAVYTEADMVRWYEVQKQIAELNEEEKLLRARIFAYHFPTPSEGVNDYALDKGYVLKGTYKINRNVDEAALVTLTPTMIQEGIPVDTVFRIKRELVVKEYRKYETEKKKLSLIDQCLVIKPGMPALDIVLPKR